MKCHIDDYENCLLVCLHIDCFNKIDVQNYESIGVLCTCSNRDRTNTMAAQLISSVRASRSTISLLGNQCINSVNYPVSRNMSATKGQSKKCLQVDNINPCIKTMEYAVR